jgi:hypothetical protein
MLTSREKWQNPLAKDHNEDPKRLSEMQRPAGVTVRERGGIAPASQGGRCCRPLRKDQRVRPHEVPEAERVGGRGV